MKNAFWEDTGQSVFIAFWARRIYENDHFDPRGQDEKSVKNYALQKGGHSTSTRCETDVEVARKNENCFV